MNIGNNFLYRPPMAQQLRKRIKKWNYMKWKSFCKSKEMVTRFISHFLQIRSQGTVQLGSLLPFSPGYNCVSQGWALI
jgi:hypothetical protein